MPMSVGGENPVIDESELRFDFIRSSGPGGQNVNKVSTAVQLRFNVKDSPSLDPELKQRLIKLAGNRITDEGELVIEARRYRTKEQNKVDAILRLNALIQKASQKPKVRRATHPSMSAKAARVDEKKKHGKTKRIRRFNPDDWE